MSEKTIGTFVLDGLLQGDLPGGESNILNQVQAVISGLEEKGLSFSLEYQGNQFSLLPANDPLPQSLLPNGNVTDGLTQVLTEIIKPFPPPHRPRLLSTIRSVHYLPNEEVQAIYAINNAGIVECQTRSIDAATTAPPDKLTTAGKLQVALTGLAILLALFFLSSFFIDYKAWYQELTFKMTPLKPGDITLDAGAYAGLIQIKVSDIKWKRGLILEAKRGPQWPSPDALVGDLSQRKWTTFLSLQNIHRARLPYELRDKEGLLVRSSTLDISPLHEKATGTLVIPLPRSHKVTGLRFRY